LSAIRAIPPERSAAFALHDHSVTVRQYSESFATPGLAELDPPAFCAARSIELVQAAEIRIVRSGQHLHARSIGRKARVVDLDVWLRPVGVAFPGPGQDLVDLDAGPPWRERRAVVQLQSVGAFDP